MMMCTGTITPVSIDRSRYTYIYQVSMNTMWVVDSTGSGTGTGTAERLRLASCHSLEPSGRIFPGLPAACDLQMRRVGSRTGSRRRRGYIPADVLKPGMVLLFTRALVCCS